MSIFLTLYSGILPNWMVRLFPGRADWTRTGLAAVADLTQVKGTD